MIPVESVAWTRLPGSTSRSPVRPSNGAVMVQNSRFSFAVVIAASSPAILAWVCATVAFCVSTCWREAKSLRARFAYRVRSSRALASNASSAAFLACACASAAA